MFLYLCVALCHLLSRAPAPASQSGPQGRADCEWILDGAVVDGAWTLKEESIQGAIAEAMLT
jgi:hypothetical protein